VNRIEIASEAPVDPVWTERCRRFIAGVLRQRKIKNWELSILLCDDRHIRELNHRYRGVDTATDVLSFPQDEAPGGGNDGHRTAGDVVISLETTRRNARLHKISEEEELKRLLVHGILHLEGMDHLEEQTEMIGIQENILMRMSKERIF